MSATDGGSASPGPIQASDEDLGRAVKILVGAFHDDPLWAWAFPDPERRAEQHRWLWGLYVDGAARYSGVWLDAERNAVAVWIPPGGTELTLEQEASLGHMLVELAGPEGAGRVSELGDAFEQAHPEHQDHHYLSLLGTDPAHRGRGLGLGLLRQTLRAVDETGLPAYLEASNVANVPLYERLGFRVRDRFRVADGPEVVTMWRPASALG